jgi:tRNA(Ile)-lysidine synthetase-like protein
VHGKSRWLWNNEDRGTSRFGKDWLRRVESNANVTVFNQLSLNGVSEIAQRTHNPPVTPGTILFGKLEHQIFDRLARRARFAKVHALLQRLVAVHVHKDCGTTGRKVVLKPASSGRFARRFEELVQVAIEELNILPGAILQDEGEAACCTNPLCPGLVELSGFGISNFQKRWTVKLRGCLGSLALQTVKIVKSFSVHHRCSAGQKAKPTKGENEALWLAARIDHRQITSAYAMGTEWFDAERIGDTIILRHWQAGDRFQPSGMPRPVKLQDLFTNLKVPAAERRQRIVATTAAGELWWVEGPARR